MTNKGTLAKETLHTLRYMAAPFFTLILGKLLFELLAFEFPSLHSHLLGSIAALEQNPPQAILFSEFKARLLWLTSVIVYLIIYTGFFAFIWQTMTRTLNSKGLLLYLGITAFSVLVEIVYLQGIVDAATSPLRAIFEFTYNTLIVSGIYSRNELTVIAAVLDFINLFAFVIAPLTILTGCSIMQERADPEMPELDTLRMRSRHLKDLLTGASAIMVTGIIFMKVWLSWPLSFIIEAALHGQLETITLTIAQYWGITYTLTIVALYLPPAIALSNQARAVIMAGNDADLKKNPEKWLSDNKLLPSPTAQMPQLIATIAPMLVGSFASGIGRILPF